MTALKKDGFTFKKADEGESPSVPESAERAVELASNGALASTLSVTVRAVAGEPYDRITDYELGDLPEAVPAELLGSAEPSFDEIPF